MEPRSAQEEPVTGALVEVEQEEWNDEDAGIVEAKSPMTLASRMLRQYCRLVERRPCCLIFLYIVVLIVLMGALYRPLEVDTDFGAFIRADGEAARGREAYLIALGEKKGPDGRRLGLLPSAENQSALLVGEESIRDFEIPPELQPLADEGAPLDRRLQSTLKLVNEQVLYIIYEAVDGDALDERALKEIRDFELRLRNLPGWQRLCGEKSVEAYRYKCDPGESISAYAWPSLELTEETDASAKAQHGFVMRFDGHGNDQLALPAMLAYLETNERVLHDLQRYLPTYYTPPSMNGVGGTANPPSVRSTFTFSILLTTEAGSASALKAGLSAIKDEYRAFIVDEVYPTLRSAEDDLRHVRVYYYGSVLTGHEVALTLHQDLMWAIGSFLFVLLYLRLHTRSALVSICALLLVTVAVPLAYVLLPDVTLTSASFLALFLIIGIGSDVVFVFSDFWAQSQDMVKGSNLLRERLAWTIMHAGRNCLCTSLTTSASFFANLASVLQPLREFGMFLGLCVLSVFLLVLLFLPPLLMVSESCRRGRKVKVKPMQSPGELMAIVPLSPEDRPATQAGGGQLDRRGEPPRKSCSETSLLLIFRCVAACPCFVVLFAAVATLVFVIGVSVAAEVDQGVPDFFPPGHNQLEVARLQDDFASVEVVKSCAMRTRGVVCPLDRDSMAVAEDPNPFGEEGRCGSKGTSMLCDMHWCEAALSDQTSSLPGGKQPAEIDRALQGKCFRGPTIRNGATSSEESLRYSASGCQRVDVDHRLARRSMPDSEWGQVWEAALLEMVAPLQVSNTLNTGVPWKSLKPLVLEDWETGHVETSQFYRAPTKRLIMESSGSNIRCKVKTFCFFDSPWCDMPAMDSSTWIPMPSLNLSTPAAPVRRLSPEGDVSLDVDEEALPLAVAVPARALQAANGAVPTHKRVYVEVLWGIRPPMYTPLVGALEEPWSIDPTFDISNPWAQRAVYSICTDYPENLLVVTGTDAGRCWINEFRNFNMGKGLPFPSRDFDNEILPWYFADVLAPGDVWFIDGVVRAAKVAFNVNMAKDAGAQNLLIYKARWDKFITDQNNAAGFTGSRAFHTAQAWVNAEAEVAVVDSTVATIAISATCGWFGTLFFTWDPLLASLVLLVVLGVISGLAFFIVCAVGWLLGPVEVIALVIFVGYSVTFSLHVAHIYHEEACKAFRNEKAPPAEYGETKKVVPAAAGESQRGPRDLERESSEDDEEFGEREDPEAECVIVGGAQQDRKPQPPPPEGSAPALPVEAAAPMDGGGGFGEGAVPEAPLSAADLRREWAKIAVMRVGCSTIGSAVSTLGASMFLLFCTMRIFMKLGAVVMVVTALSCFAALVVLPALLMLVGPGPGPWHTRMNRMMSSSTVALRGWQRTAGQTPDPKDRERLVDDPDSLNVGMPVTH
jgi:predicted RND superfamily exporter protein